ncbi:FkbM family methyltransferase [Parabacteroides pacaensis]|uniref:FkbM family methyltransferase n=1 Tax=Parabacteroides pacaensis TaxID=2086575 RepID=UPI000D100F4F|nr:FkbM family methyltransferase [Parabacteroides pacaensis]
MSSSVITGIKKFIYGTLPYTYLRIFNPTSPKLKYYKFLKEHTYSRYVYEFAQEYLNRKVQIQKDEGNGLFYVIHRNNKKLYFPRNYSILKIEKMYKALMIEQDRRHPHHYVDSLDEFQGKILLDIGAAEGFTSLDAIEKVEFVYLFECEPSWIEALTATFEPWKEKVRIIKKYISNHNDVVNQTLDNFLEDKPKDNLFLKMDIEGAECDALEGSKNLFSTGKNLDFAICTYHRKEDEKLISSYLNKYHCTFSAREGYIYVKHRLRVCLLRGNKAS